ncbi:ERV/ALR sulfhydryl oxidase domain-containing protein, partial [Vararia minispora EC-137]
ESSSSKPLPPGMVLGPDGKPCKICTAFRYWQPPTDSTGKPASKAASAASLAAAASSVTSSSDPRTNCPPDVEVLGRATWTFLHTTAAYYPDKPSPAQRANMLNLLHSLPTLYPCSHCANHLGECMKSNPPDVTSRTGLSWWLCQRHNEVNERLGKKVFDCNKTDERWKNGPADGSCD